MDAATLPARAAALDALAGLYEYPTAKRCAAVRGHLRTIAADCAAAAEQLAPLAVLLEDGPLSEAEEIYVRTIELNPVVALEIGWQLYGEQYARGTFMVRMRQALRDTGLPETTELPDHVTNVLKVLGRLDDETARNLAVRFVLPALKSMQAKIADAVDNPITGLLAATVTLIERHFAGAEVDSE